MFRVDVILAWRPTLALLTCLASLFSASYLAAQHVDPARFGSAESAILAHRGALAQHRAIDALLAELERLGQTDGDRRVAALAEYQALLLAKLVRGFAPPRRIATAMQRLAEQPLARAHPALRDVLRLIEARQRHHLGAYAQRDALREELGILHHWSLLGAFDNERGAGYDADLAPEREFDAKRSYQGKKHEVRWRELKVEPAIGFIDLGALMRPAQQVLAYAATCLNSRTEQVVVLRLGSSEAFKVFLNGKLLAGRDLRRPFEYDQDSICLPLRAGANFLLLKICNQEGRLGFAARLRQLDGQPVRGITAQADTNSLIDASRQTARRGDKLPPPDQGARSVFGEQPADAYRLGSVLTFYRSDDERSSRIHDLLLLATKGLPDHAAVRSGLAVTRVRSGKASAQREDNPRRHDYEAILARHPEHVASLLALTAMDLASVGPTGLARQRLATAQRLQPAAPELYAAQAELLAALDLGDHAFLAIQRGSRADAAGNFLAANRRHLARHLLRQGRLAAAQTAFESLVARSASLSDFLELANLLLRIGQRDAGVKVLGAAQRFQPYSRTPTLRLARLLEAEGDITGAMARVQWILELCSEDDGMWTEMARLYGLLGQTDRQREALRAAVDLAPNRKSVRRRLEFLEAEVKPFYHGYEIDADAVIAADRGQAREARSANDPYHSLLDQRVVRAYRNGTTSEYRHRIVRILNEAGGRQFATVRAPHYWYEQRARLLQVRVIKGEETLRPRLRGSRAKLPPLAPGDIVDYRYRVDDTAPGFFGDYFGFEHQFVGTTPTHKSRLTVILDPGRHYQTQAIHGAPQPNRSKDTDGNQVWDFEMRDLAPIDPEERQPKTSESAPLVRITTYESWAAFASWWSNLIRSQSSVSPQMRQKVQELTRNLTTDGQRIDAIYRFVTTDIRYEAWEFGVHGYKPYSTPVIFERRHGDCKDKSLLMNAMLSVLGIKAHPVLIHADPLRSKDDLQLPMVDHFNHCISFIEPTDSSPAMFLDGTANYHPVDTLPSMDYGAEVLVVRSGDAKLEQIAWPEAGDNADVDEFEISILADGNARVRYRARPTRNRAVGLRELLGNEKAKQSENIERPLRGGFGAIELTGFRTSELLDLGVPVHLDADFVAQRFARRQGTDLLVPSTIGDSKLSSLALLESRRSPLLLGPPRSERQTIHYRLPDGFAPRQLPPPTSITGKSGKFAMRWHHDANGLRVERQLALTSHRIEVADYVEFREFANQVDQASRQRLVLHRRQGAGK